tara:strand:+ start:52 stop:561 length:510 start_codon:yes stop_codon:yes gene_type:complete
MKDFARFLTESKINKEYLLSEMAIEFKHAYGMIPKHINLDNCIDKVISISEDTEQALYIAKVSLTEYADYSEELLSEVAFLAPLVLGALKHIGIAVGTELAIDAAKWSKDKVMVSLMNNPKFVEAIKNFNKNKPEYAKKLEKVIASEMKRFGVKNTRAFFAGIFKKKSK